MPGVKYYHNNTLEYTKEWTEAVLLCPKITIGFYEQCTEQICNWNLPSFICFSMVYSLQRVCLLR